jgi:membrane-bound lytic murein transglycosylase A
MRPRVGGYASIRGERILKRQSFFCQIATAISSPWLPVLLLMIVVTGCAPIPEPVEPPVVVAPQPPTPVAARQAVDWSEVDGWLEDDPALAMSALLKSCKSLRWREEWQTVCREAAAVENRSGLEIRSYFEQYFIPHRLRQEDGSPVGRVTGYYVPDLRGSRRQTPEYSYPLYRRPDDLLTIDLSEVYPSLSNYRLRGRLEGSRVIPYWDRLEIDSRQQPLAGQELFWVADPVELFFLHVQGSGRIIFEDGSRVMVNYADQNGHPYRSIGQWLIDRGMMSRDQMSMQNIRAWARNNPEQVDELLGQNPSYVFFRDLGEEIDSPPGALGVPLTPGRSLAVDPRYIPLGAPVFLASTWPNSDRPLKRLMVAQDTGGAIKGRVRADFFWGMGEQAGEQAGRMKQDVRLWVLLPRDLASGPVTD